jgi:hypothetical protein
MCSKARSQPGKRRDTEWGKGNSSGRMNSRDKRKKMLKQLKTIGKWAQNWRLEEGRGFDYVVMRVVICYSSFESCWAHTYLMDTGLTFFHLECCPFRCPCAPLPSCWPLLHGFPGRPFLTICITQGLGLGVSGKYSGKIHSHEPECLGS